ncbi:hypothetical protein ACS0TY_035600 [Phlomoides rotata]
MCPSVQPPHLEINDEQIISLLAEYTPGSLLPDNVLEDLNPYQLPLSNLPEGIWYLVDSNEKKESAHGFWKARGEACMVYSDDTISGWRTTLEYFEGTAPDGQITDWLMEEYGITKMKFSAKDMPKESRLLCRVFLCCEQKTKSEMVSRNCKNDVASGHDSGTVSKAEEYEVGEVPAIASSPPQDLWESECIARGDFLELDDLEDPLSHSSSSQNSSCTSKSSDEYFDSSAFLRDIEAEENKFSQGQSSSRYDFIASAEPIAVTLQPAVFGSVTRDCPTTDEIEVSTASGETSHERSTKRQNPESRNEGESTSSSNSKNEGDKKKAGTSRLKKLKTYFCFATF